MSNGINTNDIGESLTIDDILASHFTDGCRYLSATLYFPVHLISAYLALKLDLLAAITNPYVVLCDHPITC